MERKTENIALFDMDGTLCDYDSGLFLALEKLRSPAEPVFNLPLREDAPDYIKERANLIRASESWWVSLPKLNLGWNVLESARKLEYRIMILTQGPRRNPAAWAGKKKWIDINLGEDVDITITRDKGLVYGRVLVDDYPEYAERWLAWRPRGLVIMPANAQNQNYTHKQVIKYNGTNLSQVEEAMRQARLR